jgi:hypothetical protein
MGRLKALIDAAYEGTSIQERLYGPFPVSAVARDCGPDEVADAVALLEHYVIRWEEVEADGDMQDDYWRLRVGMTQLLEALIGRFPLVVAACLQSPQAATRIVGARLIANHPSEKFVDPVREAIRVEQDEAVRGVLQQALSKSESQHGGSRRP